MNKNFQSCAQCRYFEDVNEQTGFCTYLRKVAFKYDNTCPFFESDSNKEKTCVRTKTHSGTLRQLIGKT